MRAFLSGILVYGSTNIDIRNNIFNGFHPPGFIWCWICTTAIIEDNSFAVDTTESYYDVIPGSMKFLYAPIYYLSSVDTTTINNQFHYKANEIELPYGFIYYKTNNGTNCLSGNSFINYALHAYETSITSCFRKSLVECTYNLSIIALTVWEKWHYFSENFYLFSCFHQK